MSSTRRTVIKNTSAMLLSQVVTWTLTLVFSIVLRRYLGPEGSGHLVIAQSIWLIAGVFIGFGMDMLLTREIARDHGGPPSCSAPRTCCGWASTSWAAPPCSPAASRWATTARRWR